MHVLSRQEAMQFVEARRDVLDAASVENPFVAADWILAFLEHVARDDWRFVVPELAGVPPVFMLLYRAGRTGGLRSLTNYYVSLQRPVVGMPGRGLAALPALVDQLHALRPCVGTLDLAPLDRQTAVELGAPGVFPGSDWRLKRYFCFGNWYLPCAGVSYERYFQDRSSQIRNTIARKGKRFAGEGGTLEIVEQPADVERGLAAYWTVYDRSWKVAEPYRDFISAWARRCAQRGWLRLGLAHVRGIPIAAQFWFTMHRRASIFKLAYDEARAKHSAGTLLTAHLMQHSLDRDGVAEIDYLSGDDPYKSSWMTARRERYGVLACNLHTLRGRATALREWASDVRARLRSRPGFSPGVATQSGD